MAFFQILLLALALSADAFTVGTSVGFRHHKPRQLFRLSFHFGLFQSLMALIGALAGSIVIVYLSDYDHWIVCAVLSIVGVRMIYSAVQHEEDKQAEVDLTRGMSLVGLSVAVSIDALAAGIGLSALEAPLALAIVTIGVVAGLATLTAQLMAGKIGQRVGRWCEIAAGLVLILLGIWSPLKDLAII